MGPSSVGQELVVTEIEKTETMVLKQREQRTDPLSAGRSQHRLARGGFRSPRYSRSIFTEYPMHLKCTSVAE